MTSSERDQAIKCTIANCPPERRPKATWRTLFPDWNTPSHPYNFSINEGTLRALKIGEVKIHKLTLLERCAVAWDTFRWNLAEQLNRLAVRIQPW